jgi:thiamine-phosphate pyrophosphorylase
MRDALKGSFYGILDAGYVPDHLWFSKCVALIRGGASIIQLRAKSASTTQRAKLLEAILPLFEKSSIPLIINDDIDLALKYPNLGLHIGQKDLHPEAARERLGSDRILGWSTHSWEQANAATALAHILDYFAVGPIFTTQTKPDYVPVGLDLLKRVAASQPPIPFFCIGGINRKNIDSVRAAGGQRIVVVSDVLCAEDTAQAVNDFVLAH